MLLPVPSRFRKRRRTKVRRQTPAPAPAAGPLLVSANMVQYDPPVIRLGFDREIDLVNFDPQAVAVELGNSTGMQYIGTSLYDLPDNQSIEIQILETGGAVGGLDLFNATGQTGIIAFSTGDAWAGASNVEVPYP